MAKILKIELTMPPEEFLHQFRNFGEDVYRDLKDECAVSLDEIDSAITVFYVRDLRSKIAHTAAARVRKIALAHSMAAMIDVSEVPE
jgi:hypothetical protein